MKAKEYFDRCARILDQRAWKPATAPWAAWAWDVAAAEIGPAAGKLIVDLGSGTGAGVENLMRTTHGASFLGVDFSEEMTRCASEKRLGRAENIAVEFRVQKLTGWTCLPTLSAISFRQAPSTMCATSGRCLRGSLTCWSQAGAS